MKRLLSLLLLLVLLGATWGVQASDQSLSPDQPLADLEPGWNRIAAGGETICADGSAYDFFVHPGESENLMIYFQGGGACWNDTMCAQGGMAGESGKVYTNQVTFDPITPLTGVFEFENEENPVADYNTVVLPYCSGDVFTGNRTVTYQGDEGAYEIQHKGYVNASTVLDWVYENFPAPEKVLVTGSSAGGIGASFHVIPVLDHYQDATVLHLNDGYMGVTPEVFDGFDTWGFYDIFPDWLSALEGNFNQVEYYKALAEHYPDNQFAQYTTAFDNVQIIFYTLQQVEDWSAGVLILLQARGKLEEIAPAWSATLQADLAAVNAATPNYSYFLAGGDLHTILSRPEFYTYHSNGVRFLDWFTAYLDGEAVEDVQCVACEEPDLAAAE